MIDVDGLKAHIDIEDVIEWLDLERPMRVGRTLKILCPIPEHVERWPSCVIYEQTDSWYCFGCQRGGDVIALVQAVKGLSFLDAAQWVAEHTGESLGPYRGSEGPAMTYVEPVSAQAHADVVEWLRQSGPHSVPLSDSIFGDYDETMRAYDAKEIDAKEAIMRLIDWRKTWKERLS